jgi:hypothetical protein
MAVRTDNAAAVAAAEQELMAGRGELGVVERSAIRLAAKLSVKIERAGPNDDPLKMVDTLARVVALLPPKVAPDPAGFDWARLSDDDVETMGRIYMKATQTSEAEMRARERLAADRLEAERRATFEEKSGGYPLN